MQIVHSDFQDQLVRGLTHRMNNILTLFHGYIGLLLDDQKLDKSTLDGLSRIKEGARAASELMDRTHSLARPSALVWREIDLAEFLRMLKPTFEVLCGPRTRVEMEIADGLAPIWADATRIKTAVSEVVRNAIDATEAGGTVKVSLQQAPAPAGVAPVKPIERLLLTVIDDGPGIPEESAERIFQPFFTTKKRASTAGLGLTVAREFVQQVGGSLHFSSVPGRTEFQLLLPVRTSA
jgi:two-component system, cell cycle sensor histidine kinase and response regulator CckA